MFFFLYEIQCATIYTQLSESFLFYFNAKLLISKIFFSQIHQKEINVLCFVQHVAMSFVLHLFKLDSGICLI